MHQTCFLHPWPCLPWTCLRSNHHRSTCPKQAPVDVLLCGARGRHGMAARRPLPRVQHQSDTCISRTNNLLVPTSPRFSTLICPDTSPPLLILILLVGMPAIRSHPFRNARLHLCHDRAAHRGHTTDLLLPVLLEASLRSARRRACQ